MKYIIPTKLVGVTFSNSIGIPRQTLLKAIPPNPALTDFEILAEPDNQYDKNSHLVFYKRQDIGHINKDLSAELVTKKSNGERILGITSCQVTGGENKKSLGLNITIQMEQTP